MFVVDGKTLVLVLRAFIGRLYWSMHARVDLFVDKLLTHIGTELHSRFIKI